MVWAQAGFYVTPSFSFAEVYDDNLFSSSAQREQDLISRFSPEIKIGYESVPFTLSGRYTFDAEVFTEHPELTTAQARQRASIDSRYLPTPPLTLSLTAAYTDTQTPQELNMLTGLARGRQRASQFSFSPSTAYRFDPFTTGTGAYTFTDEQSGDIKSDVHVANLSLDRRITPMDTVGIGYILRYFHFSGDDFVGDDTVTAHSLLLGWTRQITPLTRFEVRAGPRFSEGSMDVEALFSVRHRVKHGELSFTYSRTQATVAGEAEVVDTDSVSALLTYELLPFLKMNAAPLFARNTLGDSEVNVYQMSLNTLYQINKWLSLQGSYHFSFQQGRLGSDTSVERSNDDHIYHNIILLGFVLSYPYRIY